MKRNILALYIIKLSKWFTLVMPIIVLFYEDHGLGLQDVFILKSVYSIAAVALEIPSGYLADVWGTTQMPHTRMHSFLFGISLLLLHLYLRRLCHSRNTIGNRANAGQRGRLRLAVRYDSPI